MARNIKTTIDPYVELHISIMHKDGSIDMKHLKVNSLVENLRFAKNGEIKSVTGRVAEITYSINKKAKRFYSNINKLQSYFKYDVIAENIVIDSSEVNNSHLDIIPIRELLEDEGTSEVAKITYYLSYGFNGEVLRSDNSINKFSLEEGQIINDLVYLFGGSEKSIPSAKLVAVSREKDNIKPVTMYMNMSGMLKAVKTNQIVSIGESSDVLSQLDSISEAINGLTEGNSTIYLDSCTFYDPVNITKSVKILGAKANINPMDGNRNKTTFAGESVIAGAITLSPNVELELNGLVLSEKAFLSVGSASNVTIKNCIVIGLTPAAKKSCFIMTGSGTPLKLILENNYFGPFVPGENTGIWNFVNIDCTLVNGSKISGNYFEKGYNNNDGISIYNVENGAVIEISDNTWEFSGNGVRLGIKGNPTAMFNIRDNIYHSTLENDNAGLLCIQPYNRSTTSMSGITINLSNITHDDDRRTWYLFQTKNDMEFTEETIPVVIEDGVKVEKPLESHLYRYS